jgi:hypothetical protein
VLPALAAFATFFEESEALGFDELERATADNSTDNP